MMRNEGSSPPLPLLLGGAALLPLALAALLLWLVVLPAKRDGFEPGLQVVSAPDADALQAAFDRFGYQWPPGDAVPPLQVEKLPSDLGELEVARKKRLFFGALLPLVVAENERIRRLRRAVRERLDSGPLRPGSAAWQWLTALANEYGVESEPSDPLFERRLLRRLDVVPAGLALAQAANESAWGLSRFAREGNNLFGQWTWDASQGMVPLRRAAGANHFVRVFPDLRRSVRAYFKNLNTGASYRDFRRLRAAMREAGRPLDALELAGGLRRYSERGLSYVNEIRAMIRYNGLNDLGPFRLAPPATAD